MVNNAKDIEKLANMMESKYKINKNIEKKNLTNLCEITSKFIKKLENQSERLTKSLIKKSVAKFNSEDISIMNRFNLLELKILSYEISDKGVYYLFELIDKMLNCSWTFKIRYSELKELHSSFEDFIEVHFFQNLL